MDKSLSGSFHLNKCFIVDDGNFQNPLPDSWENRQWWYTGKKCNVCHVSCLFRFTLNDFLKQESSGWALIWILMFSGWECKGNCVWYAPPSNSAPIDILHRCSISVCIMYEHVFDSLHAQAPIIPSKALGGRSSPQPGAADPFTHMAALVEFDNHSFIKYRRINGSDWPLINQVSERKREEHRGTFLKRSLQSSRDEKWAQSNQ